MQLTVSEAVNFLKIPEGTIKRWIRQGTIPCVYHGGKYLFDLETLRTWAKSKGLRINSDQVSVLQTENFKKDSDVIASIRLGKIYHDLDLQTKEDAFQTIQEFSGKLIPPSLQIATLLQERERIASTSIGNGIAIPHLPRPLTQLEQPIISIFFPKQPITEEQHPPIFVFFILISTTLHNHLNLLLQLSQTLKLQKTANQLREKRDFDSIIPFFANS